MHQHETLTRGVLQEFMEVARQNMPMLSGLPAPLLRAINKNDPDELQRIFRSGAVHALLPYDAPEVAPDM